MRGASVRGLRSRGLDVLTAHEAGMLNRDDEQHLAFAAGQKRTLYSFNSRDYFKIHTRWVESGKSHSGIITTRQRRFTVGEQIRRLVRLCEQLSAEEMQNRIEFLGQWL